MHVMWWSQQEQAEADRDGMWVPEEMVRVADWAESEASEGGGGAEGHESGPSHRYLAPHQRAPPSIHSYHVPPLRARDLQLPAW